MRIAIAAAVLLVLVGFAGFTTGQAKKGTEPVFEVYLDKSEEYRFRFKEGDTILAIAGKGYKTKADVDKVIDQIKKDAGKAKVVTEKSK